MSLHIAVRLTLVFTAIFTAGCASLLPKAKSESEAQWKTFEEIKCTFDSIEPGKTTLTEIRKMGFDPYANKNVTVLHFSDVLNRYAPNVVRDEYLEPGIRECLRMQTQCSAYAIEHRRIHRNRVGNFVLDFINFERRTEITGWRFSAVVVIVGDRVVYKSWSGTPAISESEETHNPLGPMQDRSSFLLPR